MLKMPLSPRFATNTCVSLALVALALALSLSLPGTALAQSQRVALVIGNAAYKEGALQNPLNDARLMAQTLAQLGFKVRKVENADFRTLQREVRDFGAAAQGAEVAFMYYAGHGLQHEGENYLVPIGAQIDKSADLASEAVQASTVLRQIEGAGVRVGIVVLDACRNSPVYSRVRSVSRGLVRMDAPSGTIVAYAAQPGAVADDGAGGSNGLYTGHLARYLQQPGLDLKQVFELTAIAVERDSQGKQRPREDIGLRGAFALAPSKTPPPGVPTAATPAGRPGPAVAARVNGIDIPLDEVNAAWEEQKARPADGDAPPTRHKILDQLIDQALAWQQAEKLGLASVSAPLSALAPGEMQARTAIKAASARAFLDRAGASVTTPAPQEITSYFERNPSLFSQRRVYKLQEITIQVPASAHESIRQALQAAPDVNNFLAFLNKKAFKYSVSEGVRAAEQLPLAKLDVFARMTKGQAVMVPNLNEGLQVIVLADVRMQPVTLAQARPAIEKFLINERRKLLVEAELAKLRTSATVQRLGEFVAAPVTAEKSTTHK